MTKSFLELGLSEEIARAVEQLGFTEPTEIQQQAVPKALAGVDIAGQAPTGTGKTLAYLLPLLQKIDAGNNSVQALVLAPTYELAMQIAGELTKLVTAGNIPVRSLAIIGGANIVRQIEKLKKKPQVVIGSAGRILELARKGKLKLGSVSFLVLDEFDRLLDDQNQQSVTEVVELLPAKRQVLFFSATAPKKALERADALATPEHIRIEGDMTALPAMENLYFITPFRDKIETLRKLTRTLPVKRGLVFVNRVFDTEKMLEKLRYDGVRAESLLGSADKMARKNAIGAFKAGKVQLLLATDIAARGLDIEGIDYVFNMDVPDTAQIYLHRAGRTARAGAAGKVVTLVDKKEEPKIEQLAKKLAVEFRPLKRKPDGETKKKSKR